MQFDEGTWLENKKESAGSDNIESLSIYEHVKRKKKGFQDKHKLSMSQPLLFINNIIDMNT